MIEIDGGIGEGGGQILRTALCLSCITGRPFRIVNIRKGRKRPGLAPQHLASVRAASKVSGAEVAGDREGSVEISFSPGKLAAGDYSLDVGTAGSALLVLQTIAPALSFAGGKSTVLIRGGTHVPFSPSWHYADRVLLPTLRRAGIEASLSIERFGFYPKGGGSVRAEIPPAGGIRPLRLAERGKIRSVTGVSAVGNLPLSIAQRQRDVALAVLESRFAGLPFPVEIGTVAVPSPGTGTFLFLAAETEACVAGFTALGERGKRAEAVGEEAAESLAGHLATGRALDPYLPDQVAVHLAMCGEQSLFTTSRITRHLITNLSTIGLFREFSWDVEGEEGKPGTVRIGPGVSPSAGGGF